MKKIAVFFIILFVASPVFAGSVTLNSISSGVFEDGEFRTTRDSFKGRYNIDEDKVVLAEIISNDREGSFETGIEYEVIGTMVGKGLSSITVPIEKHGEEIMTCIREDRFGQAEVLIIGTTFYQYCKSSGGKFYLEYGEVL